ncbi:MAG TPA: glycerate kinase [Opitutaceae bacterium]|nr:glycerate kinase [Opitutaceae bacterium]
MRVLIAFDKFKDSMTAARACEVAACELRALHRDWQIDIAPLSDGGDGFCEILGRAVGAEMIPCRTTGPRGGGLETPVALLPWSLVPEAAHAILAQGLKTSLAPGDTIAVVEMAAASGLALLAKELRDPWHATSYGTGQLIRAAAELGAKGIVLGVGGSATSDLGIGALAALGLEFLSEEGVRFHTATPSEWHAITRIEGGVFPSIPPVWIACDVDNPLLGPRGAAAIYGPQKGLAAEDVPKLDAAAAKMAALLCLHTGRPNSLAAESGAGAAGGIAFGLRASARAALVPGAALVSAWLRIEERIAAADIVITGEGRFDATSLSGKIPGSIASRARELGKQIHVFAGSVGLESLPGAHLHAISPPELPLDAALSEGPQRLAAAVRDQFA